MIFRNVLFLFGFVLLQDAAFAEKWKPCAKGDEYELVIGGMCYQFVTAKTDFETALDNCEDHGGTLAIIDAAGIQRGLFYHLKHKLNFTDEQVYIGLSDRIEHTIWIWGDGTPVMQTYQHWEWCGWRCRGMERHCAVMNTADRTGGWMIVYCNENHEYICEFKMTEGKIETPKSKRQQNPLVGLYQNTFRKSGLAKKVNQKGIEIYSQDN